MVGKGAARAAQAALNFVAISAAPLVWPARGHVSRTCRSRENSALSPAPARGRSRNIAVEFRFQVRDIVEADEFQSGNERLKWFPVFQLCA